MDRRLKSRKFWVTVFGAAFVAGAKQLGVDAATAWQVVGIVAAYVLGQAHVDAKKALNGVLK